jgi:hypothetical protein
MKKLLIVVSALVGLGFAGYFVTANANADQLLGCIGGVNC